MRHRRWLSQLIAVFIVVMMTPSAAFLASAASPPGAGPAMVAVPAGRGINGCNGVVDSECEVDEKPGRFVETVAFEIDVTEVTVAQYRACVDVGACSAEGLNMPSSGTTDEPQLAWACNWGKADRDQHPINCVSWQAAADFCKWAKKRLPSGPEWERAARGTDGRRYPWGNEPLKPSPQANLSDKTLLDNKPGGWGLNQFVDGYVSTAPVGSFPAGDSPVGAKDMAGNVWEYVTDGNEMQRQMRGGSWSYYPIALRTSDKAYAPNGRRNGDTGFRCVR